MFLIKAQCTLIKENFVNMEGTCTCICTFKAIKNDNF